MTKYVIVGAGVVGLYTAFSLLEKGVSANEITVIAEYLPGDESINYTSPYAGGNFSCITGDDPATLEYDKYTYLNLHKIQKAIGGKTQGLDRYPSCEYWDQTPSKAKIDSLSSYLDNYEVNRDLPQGSEFGIKFLAWNFNCPKFLANFQKYLESQGVKFIRRKLTHVVQAYFDSTKVVFNCTGNGSKTLGGVQDDKVYPGRGQVVVIRAPHIMENVLSWGNDREPTYIIKRPYSGDQLILGGFFQKDDWTAAVLKEQTEDVLQRTTKLYPKILDKNPNGNRIEDLEILRVAAGLRPCRHGGVRIEKEIVGDGKLLVHNYGASGYGYQAGYGMANRATDLALGRSSKL